MASVATASTLVTAVLQTAGYKTQEFILTYLGQHLAGLATLLYIISVILALLMVGLMGRYRWGIYLFLAPTFFFFLVGVPSSIDGVVWKLGGSAPRLPNGPANSTGDALNAVRELSPGVTDRNAINVALPFKIYTQVVDKLVNTIVSTVIPLRNKIDEEKNLLFVSRAYALETLLNAKMSQSELLQMFNSEYLLSCKTMMNAAISLANSDLSLKLKDQLQSERGAMSNQRTLAIYDASTDNITTQRAKLADQWNRGKLEQVAIRPAVRKFIQENASRGDETPGVQRFLSSHPSGADSMSCDEMWGIVSDAIMLHAKEFTTSIENSYGSQLNPDDRGLVCVEIAKKLGVTILGDADRKECSEKYLVTLAGTLMLRNAVSGLSASSTLTTMKNNMEFVATEKHGAVVDMGDDSDEWEVVDESSISQEDMTHLKKDFAAFGSVGGNVFAFRRSLNGSETQRIGLFRNKQTNERQWRPISVLRADVLGNYDAVFLDHQRYQTTELRHKFFSYALNLPYYQGMLLYLLSVGYPFFALLVVVPGRAGAFLNFLLAWLWVKSWDVGFAMLMVLERLLWNLFPAQDFNVDSVVRRKIGEQELPELLTEVFKVDPAYNVHAYYYFLCIASAAIPTVCAYGTLKLRRGMVSAVGDTFMHKLTQTAESRGKDASGGYGKVVMNIRNSAMKEFAGAQMLGVGLDQRDWGGENAAYAKSGNLRHKSANAWANNYANAVEASRIADMRFDKNSSQNQNIAPSIREAAYKGAYAKMLEMETRLDARVKQIYDSKLGRFGRYSLLTEEAAAAQDASGGFEINEMGIRDKLYGARIDIANAKLGLKAEIDGYQKYADIINSPESKEFLTFYKRKLGGLDGQLTSMEAIFERGNPELIAATNSVLNDFQALGRGEKTGLETRLEAIKPEESLITSLKKSYFDWLEQKRELEKLTVEELQRFASGPVDPSVVPEQLMPFIDLPNPLPKHLQRQNLSPEYQLKEEN